MEKFDIGTPLVGRVQYHSYMHLVKELLDLL